MINADTTKKEKSEQWEPISAVQASEIRAGDIKMKTDILGEILIETIVTLEKNSFCFRTRKQAVESFKPMST